VIETFGKRRVSDAKVQMAPGLTHLRREPVMMTAREDEIRIGRRSFWRREVRGLVRVRELKSAQFHYEEAGPMLIVWAPVSVRFVYYGLAAARWCWRHARRVAR
jgi:hypothetical protein